MDQVNVVPSKRSRRRNVLLLGNMSDVRNHLIQFAQLVDDNTRCSSHPFHGQRYVVHELEFQLLHQKLRERLTSINNELWEVEQIKQWNSGFHLNLIECPSNPSLHEQRELLLQARNRLSIERVICDYQDDQTVQWFVEMGSDLMQGCNVILLERRNKSAVSISDILHTFQSASWLTVISVDIPSSTKSPVKEPQPLLRGQILSTLGFLKLLAAQRPSGMRREQGGDNLLFSQAHNWIKQSLIELRGLLAARIDVVAEDIIGLKLRIQVLESLIAKCQQRCWEADAKIGSLGTQEPVILDIERENCIRQESKETMPTSDLSFELEIQDLCIVIRQQRIFEAMLRSELESETGLCDAALRLSHKYATEMQRCDDDLIRLHDTVSSDWSLARMVKCLKMPSISGAGCAFGLKSKANLELFPDLRDQAISEGCLVMNQMHVLLQANLDALEACNSVEKELFYVTGQRATPKSLEEALKVMLNDHSKIWKEPDDSESLFTIDTSDIQEAEICHEARHDLGQLSASVEAHLNSGITSAELVSTSIAERLRELLKIATKTDAAIRETQTEIWAATRTIDLLTSGEIPIAAFAALRSSTTVVEGCLDIWRGLPDCPKCLKAEYSVEEDMFSD